MGRLTPLLVVQELGLKFKVVMLSHIIWAFGPVAARQEAEKKYCTFREGVCPAAHLVCNHF